MRRINTVVKNATGTRLTPSPHALADVLYRLSDRASQSIFTPPCCCSGAQHGIARFSVVVDETAAARWFEAEIHRLRGELLQSAADDVRNTALTPEACFQKALDVARQQQAKSWELRAASSLACLWQAQGKRQEAYDLLSPVYAWFTEGFDTADLQEAKALREELI